MRTRLIVAIITTIAQEGLIAFIVLWGLPRLEINLPLWVLVVIMLAWVLVAIAIFRAGTRALKKKALGGLTAMTGSRGRVVKPLTPEGLVRIRGELWQARALQESIDTDEEITVVGQDGLKLIVNRSDTVKHQ